jgi:PhoPQ-activated pathogenicity-related protein
MNHPLTSPRFGLRFIFIALVLFCAQLTFANASKFAVHNNLRAGKQTALDEYILKPDSSYQWRLIKHKEHTGYSTYLIDMTSQTWRSPEEVSRTQWQHWLTLVMPDKPCADTALLMVAGGANGGEAPKKISGTLLKVAEATGCAVAEIKMIPNQRLSFHGDNIGRGEDDLIGYTWDQYLKTGDATWAARMPMVKATVRAMDTLQSVMQQHGKPNQQLNNFVVAGASKRGWTTWLAGAVDKRVVAIAPIVIDVLNVDASMRHHYAAYGFWAPAVGNYLQHKIFQRMDNPKLKELYSLVDPFAYLDRLSLPKMIINGAGDQFFLPDSSQFYFDQLPGEKHIRYVPNADHSLKGSDALHTLAGFFKSVAIGRARPTINWSVDPHGAIRVTSDRQPKRVRLWQAHNSQARDFRLEMKDVYDNGYRATPLSAQKDGSYIGAATHKTKGWTAYFVEVEFESGDNIPVKLTTEVQITPDVLPYASKDPTQDNKLGPPTEG